MAPEWLTELDHTGDVGIRVYAPDERTLFARAAWAMFTVLTHPERVSDQRSWRIEVDGADRSDLLVRWLNELNFRHVTEGMLLCRFDVSVLSEHHLEAEVHGDLFDPDVHVIHTEIKAVTYHALEMADTGDGWYAQFVFDM